LSWKADIGKLDNHHYLLILWDGWRENEDPFLSLFPATSETLEILIVLVRTEERF